MNKNMDNNDRSQYSVASVYQIIKRSRRYTIPTNKHFSFDLHSRTCILFHSRQVGTYMQQPPVA